MRAIVESMGKVASRARLGNHELVFDQPPPVPGGEDRGPSPLDVMVVSVAACAHYFAAAYLHARDLSTAGLTVEVDAEKERVPISRVGRLAITIHVPPGLLKAQLAGIERAVKACPAYGTLVRPPTVELVVEGGAPAGEERRTA
jgi:putative redox protein